MLALQLGLQPLVRGAVISGACGCSVCGVALQEESLLALHDMHDLFVHFRTLGSEELRWEELLSTVRCVACHMAHHRAHCVAHSLEHCIAHCIAWRVGQRIT